MNGRLILIENCLGGSAAATGSLVTKLGGTLLGYVFILELDFLKGREKLNAPVYTLLSSQENSSSTAPGVGMGDGASEVT